MEDNVRQLRRSADPKSIVFEVGHTEDGEVIMDFTEAGMGYFAVSAEGARSVAKSLMEAADAAETYLK